MPQPPRVYKTPGIVLRQRKLGDADKIISLYTANYGKLNAVAKGVRRIKSRLAGHVEPLNHGSYMLAHGRNLDVITQAQTVETFQRLRGDLGRLSRALYAVELLDRSTEERVENFGLFRLVLDTLRRLARDDVDPDMALRFFEMTLLAQLGYRPQLQQCVICGREVGEEPAKWAAGEGGVVCADCKPADVALRAMSVNALRLLRRMQHGAFAEVGDVPVGPELAQELELHLREAVHYALDRDVRSAAFLDDVRRRDRAARRPSPASSQELSST